MNFTVSEKAFISCVDARWRYLARDESGNLFLYEEEPARKNGAYYSKDGFCVSLEVILKPGMFKNVTYENGPVCIRALTGNEADFLGKLLTLLKWKDKNFNICKKHSDDGRSYLQIYCSSIEDGFVLPKFKDETKYADLAYDRPYSKQELKIWN